MQNARERPVILLAEDDEGLRTVIQRILEESGYEVLTATDGDEALAIADRHTDEIELLMSDVRMPGIPGDELARRLRARRPDLKVILMSGSHRDAVAQNGWTALGKPFDPRVLLGAVRKALEAH